MSDAARKSIAELHLAHQNETIWILGTGPSLDHIPRNFFYDKIVVCVNDAWRYYHGCSYLIAKTPWGKNEHHDGTPPDLSMHPYRRSATRLILSEFDCGALHLNRNNLGDKEAWYFKHAANQNDGKIDYMALDSQDGLIVSYSTMTSAMHFAAHLGARAIVIAGHEGGSLDGKWRMTEYGNPMINTANKNLLRHFMRQSREVRSKLEEHYGLAICTLNPFIGFDLEGHVFDGV